MLYRAYFGQRKNRAFYWNFLLIKQTLGPEPIHLSTFEAFIWTHPSTSYALRESLFLHSWAEALWLNAKPQPLLTEKPQPHCTFYLRGAYSRWASTEGVYLWGARGLQRPFVISIEFTQIRWKLWTNAHRDTTSLRLSARAILRHQLLQSSTLRFCKAKPPVYEGGLGFSKRFNWKCGTFNPSKALACIEAKRAGNID